MTQTYPAALPSTLKVTDGTALFNPAVKAYGIGNGNSVPNFEPDVYTDKANVNGVLTAATLMPRACNMPY